MLLEKKVSFGVGFARKKPYEYQGVKYEADIKDNDLVTILDAGNIVQGQFGVQNVFKIKTRNGEKAMSINQSSQNNLIDAFGKDTTNWIGKEVKVWILKAIVAGKMQLIAYLSEPSWSMDDEGNFAKLGEQTKEKEIMPEIEEMEEETLEIPEGDTPF